MAPTDSSHALTPYVAAASLVRLADEGARVALVLLAIERAGSPGLGGVLVAALLIPHALAAPLAGAVIERAAQPRWLIAAAGVALAAALAFAAALVGAAPAALVIAVLLAAGIAGPALTGGLSAQLGRLLPAGRLPRAFGIDSMTYNLAGIAGPALVAIIATAASATVATAALAVSAAVGALVLATPALRVPAHGDDPSPASHPRAGLARAAWAALVADPVLLVVTATTTASQLAFGALPVVATSLAAARHHGEAAPWLLSALAAGALAGSLAWTARPATRQRMPAAVMASLAGVGLLLAAATLVPTITLSVVAFAAAGLFLGPLTGAMFTTRHDRSPAPVRTQIFTITAGLRVSVTAAGAALSGALTPLPAGAQLLAVAACPLLAAALGALALCRAAHHQAP